MDIGEAVKAMKDGERVARAGWNGKGMWLVFVESDEWLSPTFGDYDRLPWVGMKTVQGALVPWLCSQTDLLAEDWEVVS